MAWSLSNPNATKEREYFEDFGQDIPEGLWPPGFIDGAQSYFIAFWDLAGDRSSGVQTGRIPFLAAFAYCRNILGGDFELFWRLIRAMDDVYIKHMVSDGKPKEFNREEFRKAFKD